MEKLHEFLDPPAYGYWRKGKFYRPSHKEIFLEFLRRINITQTRKNWLPFFGWTLSLSFAIPLVIFLTHYFSWSLFAVGFVYSMVILGTHGTIWLHRYCTHRSYQFRSKVFRTLCRNLVIKVIPEEIYVVSHHLHHQISDQPGDPYNVNGGWLYCFLADVNHQTVSKTLSREKYKVLCRMLEHTGVVLNSYESYQRWGSLCHPFYTVLHYCLNWGFWYAVFFLAGGHALATAIFGLSGVWAIGVRTFNYDGHGRGKDRRRVGIDFNDRDLSVNQVWPGYVAGEWHNNHHLYPNSARSGFLNYQLDLAWIFIWVCSRLGIVSSYRNHRANFLKKYYLPYQLKKKELTHAKPLKANN